MISMVGLLGVQDGRCKLCIIFVHTKLSSHSPHFTLLVPKSLRYPLLAFSETSSFRSKVCFGLPCTRLGRSSLGFIHSWKFTHKLAAQRLDSYNIQFTAASSSSSHKSVQISHVNSTHTASSFEPHLLRNLQTQRRWRTFPLFIITFFSRSLDQCEFFS